MFIVLGTILIITSLIPGHVRTDQWDDLFGTGCFLFLIGGLLGLINRMVSKGEDEKLNSYVQRKLARSKSGLPHPHAYDDVESGRRHGHHKQGHGAHHAHGNKTKGQGKNGGRRFPYNQKKARSASSAANNGKYLVSPGEGEHHHEARHSPQGDANGKKGASPTGKRHFSE